MSKLGPYELNQVYTGDARELAPAIPDGSVDLVFTDPPYGKKYLPLYGWLAEESARILKPGGFCLAMCGGLYLPQVLQAMGHHLAFYWLYDVRMTDWAAPVIWKHANGKAMPIIDRIRRVACYSRGESIPRTGTISPISGAGADKRYHSWGQDGPSTRYFVDCFSAPGHVVVDPFSGGGTTSAMCQMIGREWLAFEIDPADAETSRGRLKNVQQVMQPLYEQAALL